MHAFNRPERSGDKNSFAYRSNCLSPSESKPWAMIVYIWSQKSELVMLLGLQLYGCKGTAFFLYVQEKNA